MKPEPVSKAEAGKMSRFLQRAITIMLALVGLPNIVIGLYFTFQASIFWGIMLVVSHLAISLLAIWQLYRSEHASRNDKEGIQEDVLALVRLLRMAADAVSREEVMLQLSVDAEDHKGAQDASIRIRTHRAVALQVIALKVCELGPKVGIQWREEEKP